VPNNIGFAYGPAAISSSKRRSAKKSRVARASTVVTGSAPRRNTAITRLAKSEARELHLGCPGAFLGRRACPVHRTTTVAGWQQLDPNAAASPRLLLVPQYSKCDAERLRAQGASVVRLKMRYSPTTQRARAFLARSFNTNRSSLPASAGFAKCASKPASKAVSRSFFEA